MTYHHALLDEQYSVKIVRRTKRGVVLEFLSGPMIGQRRFLTHRQAENTIRQEAS